PFSSGTARFCNACKEVPEGEHVRMEGDPWVTIDRSAKPVSSAGRKPLPCRSENLMPSRSTRMNHRTTIGSWLGVLILGSAMTVKAERNTEHLPCYHNENEPMFSIGLREGDYVSQDLLSARSFDNAL